VIASVENYFVRSSWAVARCSGYLNF